MPQGLQVFNDSNIIQIDSTYSNMQLVAKGTATTSYQDIPYNAQPNGTHYFSTPYTTINFTANSPVFAVSGSSTISVVSTSNSGSSWTVGVVTPSGTASFEWFVFDYTASSGSNVGLQVFNESGTLVFDAQNKYFREIGFVFDIVPTTTSGSTTGYTSPFTNSYSFPGKKCAIAAMLTPFNAGDQRYPSGSNTIPSNPHCRAFGFGGWRGTTGAAYFDFVHVVLGYGGYLDASTGGQVFAASNTAGGSPGPNYFGVKQYGGIIIDVTNY